MTLPYPERGTILGQREARHQNEQTEPASDPILGGAPSAVPRIPPDFKVGENWGSLWGRKGTYMPRALLLMEVTSSNLGHPISSSSRVPSRRVGSATKHIDPNCASTAQGFSLGVAPLTRAVVSDGSAHTSVKLCKYGPVSNHRSRTGPSKSRKPRRRGGRASSPVSRLFSRAAGPLRLAGRGGPSSTVTSSGRTAGYSTYMSTYMWALDT